MAEELSLSLFTFKLIEGIAEFSVASMEEAEIFLHFWYSGNRNYRLKSFKRLCSPETLPFSVSFLSKLTSDLIDLDTSF